MYDRKKYGDRIRQLRIQNEYTQEELAEKLGIDTSLLDDLEAGKKNARWSWSFNSPTSLG